MSLSACHFIGDEVGDVVFFARSVDRGPGNGEIVTEVAEFVHCQFHGPQTGEGQLERHVARPLSTQRLVKRQVQTQSLGVYCTRRGQFNGGFAGPEKGLGLRKGALGCLALGRNAQQEPRDEKKVAHGDLV